MSSDTHRKCMIYKSQNSYMDDGLLNGRRLAMSYIESLSVGKCDMSSLTLSLLTTACWNDLLLVKATAWLEFE